jgi:6-phosphogluconolactonase
VERTLAVIDGRNSFIHEVASAAEVVIADAIAARGVAHVVLTGGTMGIAVLTGFTFGITAKVDWSRVHFWWGDERFVGASSPDRNALQAREAFLNGANIPESNIHEMPAADSGLDLDASAESYADTLAQFATAGHALPEFDLLFLGIGPDSHVASLFPAHPDSRQTGAVIAVRNSPKPPPERVSLSFGTINTSKRIWVVACGEDKAQAVKEMFAHVDDMNIPSSCVRGLSETKLWADTAASALILALKHQPPL